jgi:hypothetical protein
MKPGKDGGFEPFHRVRLVILGVIVAGEMQESMHREVRQMMRERLALGARLAFRRLVGDHDVAEHAGRSARAARVTGRKRQHIGRAVLAAPIPVERPDRRIVRQDDGKLAFGRRHGRRSRDDRAAQQRLSVALSLPQRRLDHDVDARPRLSPARDASRAGAVHP